MPVEPASSARVELTQWEIDLQRVLADAPKQSRGCSSALAALGVIGGILHLLPPDLALEEFASDRPLIYTIGQFLFWLSILVFGPRINDTLWRGLLTRYRPQLGEHVRANLIDGSLLLRAISSEPDDIAAVGPEFARLGRKLGLSRDRNVEAGRIVDRLRWLRTRYEQLCLGAGLKPHDRALTHLRWAVNAGWFAVPLTVVAWGSVMRVVRPNPPEVVMQVETTLVMILVLSGWYLCACLGSLVKDLRRVALLDGLLTELRGPDA